MLINKGSGCAMSEAINDKTKWCKEIIRLQAELINEKKSNEKLFDLVKNREGFTFSLAEGIGELWDWRIDTDEVYYSPKWKGMLGYEMDELANNLAAWEALVHPEDKDRVLITIEGFLTGQSDILEVDMRLRHKLGHYIDIRSRGVYLKNDVNNKPSRLIGTHVDITELKKAELFERDNTKILEMIAKGDPASDIYDAIALMFEKRYPGMRCSLLELDGNTLLHGGAPSLPKEYCDAVNGLINGPNVGSCGASTYTGKRVIVENIATDVKWKNIKQFALPHGMRCCWSEPIKNSQGKVLGALGMYYDFPAKPDQKQSDDLLLAARLAGIIMEREQNQKRILNLAYIDELTGLSSRTYFFMNLEELIKTSKRYQRRFSLLYLDLDNFKLVNDSFGHDAGDALLKEVAVRLNSTRRDVDFVARLSGDEFCIVVKNLDEDWDGAKVAKRCLKMIAAPFDLLGQRYTPSCSIGIAHYPDNGTSYQALIKAADTALYAAKALGRNRYAFYNKRLTELAENRLKNEQYLREAIDNEQLSLVYQPQIDVSTGKISGVEALCRWHHVELGQVPPTEFIATAERIGMIKALTKWVLKTACQQAVDWSESGFPHIRMAINISPSYFLDNDLVPLIESIIADTQIAPSGLKLEVTEGLVQTNDNNISVFRSLNDLGVMLAIDDFGKGYSSFASLKHIKIDCMKIDKYFVDDISSDEKTYFLIRSMVEMGHSLGYEVIAEGIETQEQFDIVKKLGCDAAQGYLFSKPVEAEVVTKLLNRKFQYHKC
jgi:diguanylate cyclase (GGDEF)-like protein/PAS domain S-box-containing protein